METGLKGQNRPKNRVFWKYLKNASSDSFDFVHDIRPLLVLLSYISSILPKILDAAETGPEGQNQPENRVFGKYLKTAALDFFDFVHDFRPLYVRLNYICGMLQ